MEKKGIKYFIYVRKSSESEDRQVASIEDQIGVLNKLACEQKLEVVNIFSEAQSAKEPGRPVFGEMIGRIYKGEAKELFAGSLIV